MNMTYCRFENTLADLRDCHEHMDDFTLSETELANRAKLVKLCRLICEEYDPGESDTSK